MLEANEAPPRRSTEATVRICICIRSMVACICYLGEQATFKRKIPDAQITWKGRGSTRSECKSIQATEEIRRTKIRIEMRHQANCFIRMDGG